MGGGVRRSFREEVMFESWNKEQRDCPSGKAEEATPGRECVQRLGENVN